VDGSHDKDYQHSPVITQLALLCVEIALARYWMSLGVKPAFVLGHSLGEYAALHIAGVLTANDAIFLVGMRARLLEQKCTSGSHKMLAVRASLADIEKQAAGFSYEVACLNGPTETVLSGTIEEVNNVTKPLEAAGYRCISLDVAFAFHSAQTDPILDEFEQLAKTGVIFKAPNLPFISPLLNKVVFDDSTINANYLRRATREPVNFTAALERARKIAVVDDSTIYVDIGPHPVCTGFIKSTLKTVSLAVSSLRRGENGWTTLASSLAALHLAGVNIKWNELHRPFERSLRLLDLPTYAWNDKTYWIQYNGDWALTKGNTFYDAEKGIQQAQSTKAMSTSTFLTSTVQQIVDEKFEGNSGTVTMRSDLMQSDLLAAAHGHSMNNCGVVTSSIHADIAYTLGEYLYKKLVPRTKIVDMNILDLKVTKGLVAQVDTKVPQLIQVRISTADIRAGTAALEWACAYNNGTMGEPFATARLAFGNAGDWMMSWSPLAHLIQGRIEALDAMALQGTANRLSHSMAYTLFANNLVDYEQKYRGMQTVVMSEFEAYANVTLTTQKRGVWTIPPYFIDSVAHLAGFVMNCSDASDAKGTFCVTPGWQSMRFARPLIGGEKYQAYVKMIPTAEDPTAYFGDVYILQGGEIIGLVGAIEFHRYPRILLSRFFSPPDSAAAKSFIATTQVAAKQATLVAAVAAPTPVLVAPAPTPTPALSPTPVITTAPPVESGSVDANSTTAKALVLIANESGLEVADLDDQAGFADLGVDSLMSLVLAEKFRTELGVSVNGSLFLEYPTIGDMKAWLDEYYN